MKKQASAYIEILFENRNKEYGAYELRTNYENRLVKSFGLAIIIAGFFFLIPYVLTRILTAKHDGGIILTTIPYDLTKKYVIEKPKLSMAVSSARAKNVSSNSSYKVVEKVEEKKPVQQKPEDPVSSSENKGVGLATSDSSSSSGGNELVEDSIPTEAMSTASVDVLPVFPGGEKAMMEFLKDNLHYTEFAKENKIMGRVYVNFIVNEKGEIEAINIMRGLGFGMDEEVCRVVGIMPKWSPGKYHNQNVKTAFVMPVFFSLK